MESVVLYRGIHCRNVMHTDVGWSLEFNMEKGSPWFRCTPQCAAVTFLALEAPLDMQYIHCKKPDFVWLSMGEGNVWTIYKHDTHQTYPQSWPWFYYWQGTDRVMYWPWQSVTRPTGENNIYVVQVCNYQHTDESMLFSIHCIVKWT